jgi:ribonuclease HI
LQSLNKRKSEIPDIEGYYYPPFTSTDKNKVMTATYVRNTYQAQPIRSPSPLHSCACQVLGNDGSPVTIVNAYYPESLKQQDQISWIEKVGATKTLIVGDFNAHHEWWEGPDSKTDTAGRLLSTAITQSDLCLLNDGTATRIPDRSTDKPTAIDISLASPDMFSRLTWTVGTDPLGSDHLPITITSENQTFLSEGESCVKYNYDKADWPRFKQILTSTETIYSEDNIEAWYEELRDTILHAASLSIPTSTYNKNSRHSPNPWWNERCKTTQKEYRSALNTYRKLQNEDTFTSMKELKIKHKQAIAKAKVEYWRNFLNKNIENYRDSTKLWKKIKKINQRYRPPERPLTTAAGTVTKSNQEKADLLAETFAKASKTSSLPLNQRNHREATEATFEDPVPKNHEVINRPLTIIELDQAISSVKKVKKATGDDPISYILIKQLPEKVRLQLLRFFQACWTRGVIPSAWKKATVVAIPKPGKSPNNPQNYRPIALTPHLGKIYERIIKYRLEYFLAKNKVIPVFQAGFRKGRSCLDHTTKLTSHVKKAMTRRRPVVSTFFDIKSAYDSVWHALLMEKMKNIGISGNMYTFFKTYLANRQLQVKIGTARSNCQNIDMGLPQGSIVAPSAFSIMLYDIGRLQIKNATLTLYADDLAIWTTPKLRNLNNTYVKNRVMKEFQSNIDLISNYMHKNGFQLAPEKTIFIIFTNQRLDKSKFEIQVNNFAINPSKTVKFLGITFDEKLTWTAHIQNAIQKTYRLWNLIITVKHIPGLNHPRNMIQLVNSLVRSRLTYGQEIYFSACRSLLSRLQARETHFLKLALNIPINADPLLVYREAGLLPLDRERQLRTAQGIVRQLSVENSTNAELLREYNDKNDEVFKKLLDKKPFIARRALSVYSFAETLFESANLQTKDLPPPLPPPQPTWIFNPIDIDTSLSTCKKSENLVYLRTVAMEKINTSYEQYVKIYTDGSKLDSGDTGCAFTIPTLQVTHKFKLNEGISIFSAEAFAIQKAVQYVLEHNYIKKAVILTDSKSVLEATKNPGRNRAELLENIIQTIRTAQGQGITISLMWIPSHCNISGNDQADAAAKQAACLSQVTNHIGLSLSEATGKLKACSEQKWVNFMINIAQERNWIDTYNQGKGTFPANIPSKYLYILYRMRVKKLRFSHIIHTCLCGDSLSADHIFVCEGLKPFFSETIQKLQQSGNDFSSSTALCELHDTGWAVPAIFMRELFHCPIGHLI